MTRPTMAETIRTQYRRRQFVRRSRLVLLALAILYLVAVLAAGDWLPWRGRVIGVERRGDHLIIYRAIGGGIVEEVR